MNKDLVSLDAFLSVENRAVVPSKIRYSQDAINKKEVTANDSTWIIKLTLWGDWINSVPKDGVYVIDNVTVREWPQGSFL